MLKKQNYGIEIEMTGLTREAAAKALANYFGTNPCYKGGCYGTWEVPDTEGKTWKLVSDASIHQERKVGKGKYETVSLGKDYSVEMVSPVLTYEELPKLQEAVRQVRHAGAKVNSSCGIHIHIDGANHTPKSLRNILGIMYAKEDLLFKALQVQENRVHYCKKSRLDILTEARAEKNLTMDSSAKSGTGRRTGSHTPTSTMTRAAITPSTSTRCSARGRWSSGFSTAPFTQGKSRHTSTFASQSAPRPSGRNPRS